MQYLSWGDIQLPLCMVTGFSYAKRARVVEHKGGYASARGLEAAEISVRLSWNRSTAQAYGLDFSDWLGTIDELAADPDGTQGNVSLGGYPIYPELNFAITNINRSYVTDASSNDVHSVEADITLSGVSCVKEVCRERALIFDVDDAIIELPKVTIECNGKSMVIQESSSVARFETTPDRLELEVFIGQDDETPEREGFLNDLINERATVTCDLPQGTVTFNVISCMQVDNVLVISGSILPEAASQVVTKTFTDCDISDILNDICDTISIEHDIRVSGHVDYYLMNASPIEALMALQQSAGFIVSRQGNRITFAWLPDKITPQKTLDLIVTDDSIAELTGCVIWRDGVHEFVSGEKTGSAIEIASVFRSDAGDAFAAQVLHRQRYNETYIRIEDVLDDEIGAHSQVAIMKDGEEIAALVDYFSFDWISGSMVLECKIV